jgi:hypothetical protein
VALFVFCLPSTLTGADLDDKVNWNGLFQQSLFFLGTQHAFRLGTEPQTRAGMHGPFFRGWYSSLSNLHGWADGDGFLVNYIGHPMQGSVSGYIWLQNDGKYKKVEFGNNSAYWKSRIRATAFSFAYSSQFELGPLSEATIGKIQSRYPQQGLVDLVATPTIGLAWMIAEDALDRFVIRRFENRVENFWLRMMVRGWLNPTRSFANMMRWKEPWYRESRQGISHRGLMRPYVEPVKKPKPPPGEEFWKQVAPFEFTSSAMYLVNPGGRDAQHCVGGMGTAQWNITERYSFLAEVAGCKMHGTADNFSGDILTFGIGPRWTLRAGRWMPFAQGIIGGKRITVDEEDPILKEQVRAQQPGGQMGYETHPLYTTTHQSNGLMLGVGAGLDYALTRSATWRVGSIDYSRAWLPNSQVSKYPEGIRFTMGITLRMGTW